MKKITTIILISFLLLASNVFSQDSKFHALMVYNFTKLIDWPDKNGNFSIHILGNSGITKELKDFTEGRKAGGLQNIVVEKVTEESIRKCHILIISSSDNNRLASVLSKIKGQNVLIVTEKAGMTGKGAGIAFFSKGGAWKYQYNEGNITAMGLKMSSDFKQLGEAK